MNKISQNNLTTYTMAIGSTVVIATAFIFFMGFFTQFLQYAVDMLSLASSETHGYLQIVPLH